MCCRSGGEGAVDGALADSVGAGAASADARDAVVQVNPKLIGLPVAGRIVVEGQFVTEITHAGSPTYFAAGWLGVALSAATAPADRPLAVTRRGHSVYLTSYPAPLPLALGEEATAFVEEHGACCPEAPCAGSRCAAAACTTIAAVRTSTRSGGGC